MDQCLLRTSIGYKNVPKQLSIPVPEWRHDYGFQLLVFTPVCPASVILLSNHVFMLHISKHLTLTACSSKQKTKSQYKINKRVEDIYCHFYNAYSCFFF